MCGIHQRRHRSNGKSNASCSPQRRLMAGQSRQWNCDIAEPSGADAMEREGVDDNIKQRPMGESHAAEIGGGATVATDQTVEKVCDVHHDSTSNQLPPN